MNQIEFELIEVGIDESKIIDSIEFSEICYIDVIIDNLSIIEKNGILAGNFVYWEELYKSSQASGKYLIFTSSNGIADDSGWNYVSTVLDKKNNTLSWCFFYEKEYLFIFNLKEYQDSIKLLELRINNVDSRITLEPEFVIFPEQSNVFK